MVENNWVEDMSLAVRRVEALAEGLPEEYRAKIFRQMDVIIDYVRMNSIPRSVAIDSQGIIRFDFTDITGMPLEKIIESVNMVRSSGDGTSNNPVYDHLDKNGEPIYNG